MIEATEGDKEIHNSSMSWLQAQWKQKLFLVKEKLNEISLKTS